MKAWAIDMLALFGVAVVMVVVILAASVVVGP